MSPTILKIGDQIAIGEGGRNVEDDFVSAIAPGEPVEAQAASQRVAAIEADQLVGAVGPGVPRADDQIAQAA